MILLEDVYKIGQFNRPHGVKGELQFHFTDDIFDRIQADYILCMMDGILVPFYIESYRIRSTQSALVKLEDVDTQEQASRFANVEVFFPKALAVDSPLEELTWEYFTGFVVEDLHSGLRGQIEEVDQTTLNVLFVVRNTDQEWLLPANEDFIRNIDHENRILLLDLPEGIISMNQ